MTLSTVFASAALLLMACGDEASEPGPVGELPPQQLAACEQAAAEVAQVTARGPAMCCTGVVRLTYADLEPLAWDVVCADAEPVTEAEARTVAQTETGFGETGRRLTSTPRREHDVFLDETETGAEGVAVVSVANGNVLFGGPIGADDAPVPAPAGWRDAGVLGNLCAEAFDDEELGAVVEGYDLTDGGSALSQDELDAALTATYDTALSAGVVDGTAAYLLDGLVLLYPGTDDVAEAEWVVFVNSGYEGCSAVGEGYPQ